MAKDKTTELTLEKEGQGWTKFSVYLPPELTARVVADAEEGDRDHSEMIRRLVKLCYQYMEEEEEIKRLKERRKSVKQVSVHQSYRHPPEPEPQQGVVD